MNERIEELALQASENYDYHPEFAKKFAELIVKKCMTIGFNTVYKVDDDRNAVAVCQNIKEHFGVEE
jgi:hypothetical protein